MKTKTVRQSVTFKATAHDVYETLMDSRKHARFTQAKARISRKVGGKICAYDGYIDGTNLELIPDAKIVQSWRGSDWPEGHYSRATFCLKKLRPEPVSSSLSQGSQGPISKHQPGLA